MIDLSSQVPLSFIFGTIGVIFVIIGIGVYLVKRKAAEVKS